MDTELYRVGIRFLAFVDDKTDLKGENNCTHFCITWKRLNVQTATQTDGFSMIGGFECLIVRQKRYPIGIKNEVER